MILVSSTIGGNFTTRHPTTGVAVNADSLPTGTLVKNGVDTAVTVTITNISTGIYKWSATIPANYSVADIIQIRVAATVNSISDNSIVLSDTIETAISGTTISVVVPASVIAASTESNMISAKRGDTLRRSFTDLGNITARTKLWFTVKRKASDLDDAAFISITEAGGLLLFDGQTAPDSALGSITVDDATAGDITIYISEEITAQFPSGRAPAFVFDVQYLASGITTPVEGAFEIIPDITQAVA